MRLRGRFYFTPTSALLRRIVIYGILMFLMIIIQTSLPFMPMFYGAVPNLVLVSAAAIGFFDSEYAGAVAGITAGYFLDTLGCPSLSVMPVAGFLAGYFSGYCAVRLLPRALLPFSLCLGGVSVMNMMFTALCACAADAEVRPWLLFIRNLLPEMLYTFIFGIPAVLLAYFCTRLAGRTKKKPGQTYTVQS